MKSILKIGLMLCFIFSLQVSAQAPYFGFKPVSDTIDNSTSVLEALANVIPTLFMVILPMIILIIIIGFISLAIPTLLRLIDVSESLLRKK